jgi:hypothetical protein
MPDDSQVYGGWLDQRRGRNRVVSTLESRSEFQKLLDVELDRRKLSKNVYQRFKAECSFEILLVLLNTIQEKEL